jgi:hypothetical protein
VAGNVIKGVVENIEFRGASYRLRLSMDMEKDGTPPPVFEADLAAEKLDRLGIEKNHTVSVHMPKDRLLFFGEREE